MNARKILRILPSQATQDGDGVKIRRIVAHGNLALLDPFLLLDEIASDEAADYIGGFPPHPHRGFETVTYMLEGLMRHTDHMGNEGLLRSGGVQWMTAGKGVIHAEMPEQTEGRLHGFQLWVNLPASQKMQKAHYQEYEPEDIPIIQLDNGGYVKIIAGNFQDREGAVKNIATKASYLDIYLPQHTTLTLPTPGDYTVLLYSYLGDIMLSGNPVLQGQLAQLDKGDEVHIHASNDAHILFLMGKPINEPIANYGPFVMNTQEEIEQAIADYRNGTLTD
jgi:hypothetical protein